MSTFGSIMQRGPETLVLGPAKLRGPGYGFAKFKANGVLVSFKAYWTGNVDIHYALHRGNFVRLPEWHLMQLNLPLQDLKLFGKNTIGYDNVRMTIDAEDAAVFAVWRDEALSTVETTPSGGFFIEVGYPTYGGRDEITGTSWSREPKEYATQAAAERAAARHPAIRGGDTDADVQVVDGSGRPVNSRSTSLYDDGDMLFGLGNVPLTASLLNARRQYHLKGDVWRGGKKVNTRRLVLERHDGSRDSAFFLYLYDTSPGFIGRVGPATVAKNNKYVTFKAGKHHEIRVLREDLLEALGALA